jgi:hypothetical protein
MTTLFETLKQKCINTEKQYVNGSDYEILLKKNESLINENKKLKVTINIYQKEIELLKNKNFKNDNSIKI